ncbi:Endonuclease/exonuclease/phosphatase [Mycena floridula]|nr:Endonuclease/exonuclease/phosphatase [Mycena floridula]
MIDNDGPVIPQHGLRPLKVYRYRRVRGAWKHISKQDKEGEPPCRVQIVTWNIDFQGSRPVERLEGVLKYLEDEVLTGKNGEAPSAVVLLQEVHGRVLPELLKNSWVRDNFCVTPNDASKWGSGTVFGNVTLVSKSIKVVEASFLSFALSKMKRAAIMVDVKLRTPVGGEDIVVRIINTHLESLPTGASDRVLQLQVCAEMLKEPSISGGVVAGDMNAISEGDDRLPKMNGLRDSWWRDNSDSGYTWGYQGGGDFPKGRLDKILFLPQRGFRVSEPSRIGVGHKLEQFGFRSLGRNRREADQNAPTKMSLCLRRLTSFTTLLAIATFTTSVIAQGITVNTPGATAVVLCRPIQLSWSGGTPPYFLTIQPGDNPTGPSLVDLGQQTGTTFTWNANVTAGTSIDIQIRDSAGVIQNSAAVTVQPSSDSSCIGGGGGGGSGGSTGATGVSTTGADTPTSAVGQTTNAGTSTGAGSTPTSAPGGTGTGTGGGASTPTKPATSSASAPAKTNVAVVNSAQAGFAGIIGAVLAAVLA